MVSVLDGASGSGTTADMATRLRATLPTGWFPTSPPLPASSATPVLDGLLAGLGSAWSFCFGLLQMVVGQTRVGTATGSFLDMMSSDFFDAALPRRSGESDSGFRARILTGLISERGTRENVVQAVTGLTSAMPFICEPRRGADCGGYAGIGQGSLGGGLGYGVFGLRYGSRRLSFQYLLDVPAYASFAPGRICRRQSSATFIDQSGVMQSAAAFVMRPLFENGACVGPLLEPRSFNLIKDSRLWSGLAAPAASNEFSVNWFVDETTPGVLADDAVLAIVGLAGTRVMGPTIDLAAAGANVVGSAWIMIPAGSGFGKVELMLSDLNNAESVVYVAVDMTLLGGWQRVSASIQPQAMLGRNLRMGFALTSANQEPLGTLRMFTQCWQIEPGTAPTSYIPTAGALGIRAQDDVLDLAPSGSPSNFVSADVENVVASMIPAATIAWTSVAPAWVVV